MSKIFWSYPLVQPSFLAVHLAAQLPSTNIFLITV